MLACPALQTSSIISARRMVSKIVAPKSRRLRMRRVLVPFFGGRFFGCSNGGGCRGSDGIVRIIGFMMLDPYSAPRLTARIQRHAERKRLLPRCAERPFERLRDFCGWRSFTSRRFQFANVLLGPFTPLCHNLLRLFEAVFVTRVSTTRHFNPAPPTRRRQN